MSHEKPWRVVHVSGNREKQVVKHLEARYVEHYLPLYRDRRRWADRTVTAERPLFSGYVFARPEPQQRINVLSIPGILRVMGSEERDLVSHDEIEKIQKGLSGGLLLRPHSAITVGKHVRVLNGVFAGAEGMVRDLRHQHCCAILSLGNTSQCFSLEVNVDDLEVMPASPMSVAHYALA